MGSALLPGRPRRVEAMHILLGSMVDQRSLYCIPPRPIWHILGLHKHLELRMVHKK